MTQEHFEHLMVMVVDGVASPEERTALMSYLADKPQLQTQLESHRSIKAITDGWADRLEADLAEGRHQQSIAYRVERALVVTLLLGGTAILVGFGVWELLLDPKAPLWMKIGTSAITGGGLLGLLSVLRWRLSTSDRYTEVIR
jgi:hypothetical protein